jgi:hypothetical protein
VGQSRGEFNTSASNLGNGNLGGSGAFNFSYKNPNNEVNSSFINGNSGIVNFRNNIINRSIERL